MTIDFHRIAEARYASLDHKVIKDWPRAKEQAFKRLLAAIDHPEGGYPAGDVLDWSDSAWARAEDLIEDRAAPVGNAQRIALHKFRMESQ